MYYIANFTLSNSPSTLTVFSNGINQWYINTTSNKYNFNLSGTTYSNMNPFYMFGGSVTQVTENYTFTNIPTDLKKVDYKPKFASTLSGTMLLPLVWSCGTYGWSCSAMWLNSPPLTAVPFTTTVYSSQPKDFYTWYQPGAEFSTPILDIATGIRKAWANASEAFAGMLNSTTQYTGLGPTVWFGKFQNSNAIVSLISNSTVLQTPLLRQDYDLISHNVLPSLLTRNGVEIGRDIIPAFSKEFGPGYNWQPMFSLNSSGAPHLFKASFPYYILGQSLNGSVEASFNTALANKNSPFIKRFYMYTADQRSEVYSTTATNRMEFEIDPNDGSVSSVSLEYSVDGGANTPISGTLSGGTFIATLPSVTTGTKALFHMKATDDSGNYLLYSFELPIIATPNNTISLTSISISGTAVVGQILSSTLSPSAGTATYQWQSATTSSGTYSNISLATQSTYTLTSTELDKYVKVVATGTGSYTGTVTSNSVGPITTTPSPDTTLPVISITAPLNGSTIAGTTTISANATDNVGVTKVDFYQGTILLGTDTTAPYSMSWNTTEVSNGTYNLTAKAYDVAGNIGTSSSVTISIANATNPTPTDNIPPVVSIISPINNAIVSGLITISASATDNVKVTKMQILIDNIVVRSTAKSSISYKWNTGNASTGSHTIVVKAYDAAGNVGESSVTVTK